MLPTEWFARVFGDMTSMPENGLANQENFLRAGLPYQKSICLHLDHAMRHHCNRNLHPVAPFRPSLIFFRGGNHVRPSISIVIFPEAKLPGVSARQDFECGVLTNYPICDQLHFSVQRSVGTRTGEELTSGSII
jgi:hypothetical protein